VIEVCAFLLLFFATGIRRPLRRPAPSDRPDAGDAILTLVESGR
jgi:hypothetical protein